MRIQSIILLAVLCYQISAVDPPVWPNTFSQRFVETYIIGNQSFFSVGEHFYDAAHQRSRFDRKNGLHAALCNSILNETTACTNLVVGGKRYIYFPEKKSGCFCCDSAHGCGILRPDWLSEATYEGIENLLGEDFYKWSKPGTELANSDGSVLDYYWASVTGPRIPRRLDEAGVHVLDYLQNTYNTSAIPDSVFEIPSYVKGDCPATSKCAKFR